MSDLRDHGLIPLADVAEELARATRGIPMHARDGSIRAFAMVDAADYDSLAGYRWSLSPKGYAYRRPHHKGPTILMSRELLGFPDGFVDHRNTDTLNNTRGNLRVVDRSGNGQNRRGANRNSKSGHRNVSWIARDRKYRVSGRVLGTHFHVGDFADLDDAVAAAKAFRVEHMPFSTR